MIDNNDFDVESIKAKYISYYQREIDSLNEMTRCLGNIQATIKFKEYKSNKLSWKRLFGYD